MWVLFVDREITLEDECGSGLFILDTWAQKCKFSVNASFICQESELLKADTARNWNMIVKWKKKELWWDYKTATAYMLSEAVSTSLVRKHLPKQQYK